MTEREYLLVRAQAELNLASHALREIMPETVGLHVPTWNHMVELLEKHENEISRQLDTT